MQLCQVYAPKRATCNRDALRCHQRTDGSGSDEVSLLANTGLGAALITLLWINSAVLLPLSQGRALPARDALSCGLTRAAFHWRGHERGRNNFKLQRNTNSSKHLTPSPGHRAKRQHSSPFPPPDKGNARSQPNAGAPEESRAHRNVKSVRAFHLGRRKFWLSSAKATGISCWEGSASGQLRTFLPAEQGLAPSGDDGRGRDPPALLGSRRRPGARPGRPASR